MPIISWIASLPLAMTKLVYSLKISSPLGGHVMAKKASIKPISAAEFDRMFDDGEDISDYIDWSSTTSFYDVHFVEKFGKRPDVKKKENILKDAKRRKINKWLPSPLAGEGGPRMRVG